LPALLSSDALTSECTFHSCNLGNILFIPQSALLLQPEHAITKNVNLKLPVMSHFFKSLLKVRNMLFVVEHIRSSLLTQVKQRTYNATLWCVRIFALFSIRCHLSHFVLITSVASERRPLKHFCHRNTNICSLLCC